MSGDQHRVSYIPSGRQHHAPDNPDPDPSGDDDAAMQKRAAAAAAALAASTAAELRATNDRNALAINTQEDTSKKSAEPMAEIIGDELKSVILDPKHPQYRKVNRVCILDVDRNWTIEAIHGHALKKANHSGGSAASATENLPAGAESSASNSNLASSGAGLNEDQIETDSGIVIYPHDAEEVLKRMDPSIHVETVYLRPDVRQAIAAIRRRKHTVDVWINLYDRADETGVEITRYMLKEGLAFTGAADRFYDPTRMELKRLCRYNKIPTPSFAIIVDSSLARGLPAQLGGFPLFVKPEHGYDSVGIDEGSVIHNVEDLCGRVAKIVDEFGAALVERYVDGREFSVLVAGAKGNIQCFPPVEYRFPKDRQPGAAAGAKKKAGGAGAAADASVASTPDASPSGSPIASADDAPLASPSPAPSTTSSTGSTGSSAASFITFDDKWGANFENRWFLLADDEAALGAELMEVAVKLYDAFDGEGLARFDIRMEASTGKLMVLDVNPNCSLFYKDECTADTILRLVPGWSKERFMRFLIDSAFERQRKFHVAHSFLVKYSEEHGFSLHAARDLAVGDLVYTDEESPLRLVTRTHAEKTWNAKELSNFDAYAWPVGEGVFAIWDQESSKWKPINHSCDPNTWMSGLAVVARRPIAKGAELTLDYATFEPTHPEFECWCGAAQCRKMVRPNEYKEAWFQERYGEFVSPHILSLIQKEKHERARAGAAAAAPVAAASAVERKPNDGQHAVGVAS